MAISARFRHSRVSSSCFRSRISRNPASSVGVFFISSLSPYRRPNVSSTEVSTPESPIWKASAAVSRKIRWIQSANAAPEMRNLPVCVTADAVLSAVRYPALPRNKPRLPFLGGPRITIQGIAHFLRETGGREWLLQKRSSPLDAFLEHDILSVPGHKHDFHGGPQLEGTFREFASAEFGHYNVGNQQIDGALVGFAARQTFTPVAGLENSVPARLQDQAGKLADGIFVLHQQNDSGAFRRRGETSGRTRSVVHRLGYCRQEDS